MRRNLHSKLRKGRGKLTIRDLTLNALERGKKAGIDRMIFGVEVMLPRKPASDLSPQRRQGAK